MWFKINSVNGHIWILDVTKDKDLRRRLVEFYVSVSRWGLNLYLQFTVGASLTAGRLWYVLF